MAESHPVMEREVMRILLKGGNAAPEHPGPESLEL